MTTTTLETGTDELLCTVEGHIGTITLNRPERRNALSDTLTPAMRQSLLDLEAEPDVRVVIITGAGRAFCSGGDVSQLGKAFAGRTPHADRSGVPEQIRNLQHRQDTLALRLYNLAKPTIAVLPGAAAGAGMAIALACDIRLAADTAFLAAGYVKIGLSGDYGGSWLLAQLVGPGRAKEIYFTGRRVEAAEALRLGIFNEVVPAGGLQARAGELAASIAAGPPLALRFMKENLNRATTDDFRTCLDLEADRMVRCVNTGDHLEGVDAFMEKRTPKFTGR